MTQTLGVVYSDAFQQYDFGPTHPMKPTRLKLTYELMRATNLLSAGNVKVVDPRPASRDELSLFHEEAYLDFVKTASDVGTGYLDMGDTPAFKGCYESSALATGSSLKAVDMVMTGEVTHAMNISGGLHHAHRDRASGFCIFNDPAVAIAYIKKKYSIEKILYLDIDAHHGDGVMYGFYSDAGVLDVDFHEDGHHLFPGTGYANEIGEEAGSGFKINVPLLPFTGNELFLNLFHQIVPTVVRNYKPKILLLQCGADAHANDLLAHLQLTSKAYVDVIQSMHDLAHEVAEGRLVVFGGGGYNQANVARTWTMAAATLASVALPTETPGAWQKLFELLVGEKAPVPISSDSEAKTAFSSRVDGNHSSEVFKDLKRRISLLS
ncbi:MAG TPA: acetoin utilization protein AcuC [Candidatus Acidoferrales bacterium]|nr:acetoin utilization protein AcuC [Candidatus Acidoferrales bacterium]